MSKYLKIFLLIVTAAFAGIFIGLLLGLKYSMAAWLFLLVFTDLFAHFWTTWLAGCVLAPLVCAGVADLSGGRGATGAKIGLLAAVGIGIVSLVLISLANCQV